MRPLEIDPAICRSLPSHVSFRAIPARESLLSDVCRSFGFTFWGSAADLLLQVIAARPDLLDGLDLSATPARVLHGGGDTLESGGGKEVAKLSCGVLSEAAHALAVRIARQERINPGQATSVLLHAAGPRAYAAVWDFLDQGADQ